MLLVRGQGGAQVKQLQHELIQLGFGRYLKKYGADGAFGQATETAVKKFQSWANIQVDGKAGNQTISTINNKMVRAGLDGTYNFNISEFYSQGRDKPPKGMDNKLLLLLEKLRYNLDNHPVIINSGYRTPAHNKRVGGVSDSQHVKAKAADIVVMNTPAYAVYNEAVKVFDNGGVGKYNNFTHVDTRGYRARW